MTSLQHVAHDGDIRPCDKQPCLFFFKRLTLSSSSWSFSWLDVVVVSGVLRHKLASRAQRSTRRCQKCPTRRCRLASSSFGSCAGPR